MLIKDQVALVTGASRGIGKATAIKLAEHGAHVAINGTNAQRLQEVAQEIMQRGRQCVIVPGDISQDGIARDIINEITQQWGNLHILVNNAGIIRRDPIEVMSTQEWNRVLEVNLTGAMLTCQSAIGVMKEQQYGKIINISSTAAKLYHEHSSPSYGASKAGLLYLTRHLAMELAPQGIYVNAICPGPISTDMTDGWTPEFREKALANIPLGRMGTCDELADAVLFLASSMSNFVVGETINVNGGVFLD